MGLVIGSCALRRACRSGIAPPLPLRLQKARDASRYGEWRVPDNSVRTCDNALGEKGKGECAMTGEPNDAEAIAPRDPTGEYLRDNGFSWDWKPVPTAWELD